MTIRDQLRQYEIGHGVSPPWPEGSPAFEAAFQGLCQRKQLELQEQIAKHVQLLFFLEEFFKDVASRGKETKKLQKNKASQREKIRHTAQHWHAWGEARANVPQAERGMPDELMADIMRGNYPWQSSQADGVLPISGGWQLFDT